MNKYIQCKRCKKFKTKTYNKIINQNKINWVDDFCFNCWELRSEFQEHIKPEALRFFALSRFRKLKELE